MNTVTVVGNITRDPELRYTPNGAAVVKFGIAVNRSYVNRNGEKVEQTDFFTVNAWRSGCGGCPIKKGEPPGLASRGGSLEAVDPLTQPTLPRSCRRSRRRPALGVQSGDDCTMGTRGPTAPRSHSWRPGEIPAGRSDAGG